MTSNEPLAKKHHLIAVEISHENRQKVFLAPIPTLSASVSDHPRLEPCYAALSATRRDPGRPVEISQSRIGELSLTFRFGFRHETNAFAMSAISPVIVI
jgi:hypothetical protein